MPQTISQGDAMPEMLTPADRQADRAAALKTAARVIGVGAYLGLSFAAAYAVLKLDAQGVWRMALIWGPIAGSALVGGLVAHEIRKMDERERATAYRSMAYGALALAGMMMGAAASSMMRPEPSDGVAVVAFMALPLLLTWSLMMPSILRGLRARDRDC